MPTETTPLTVLLIDDDALIRWAVSETLSDAGHVVAEAPDSAEGLRAVVGTARPFDVIVLDFPLPDSNDFTLLAAIRTWAPGSAVVLTTGSATPEMVTDAHRFGVYRVLGKPFDLAELQNVVTAVSDASRSLRGDVDGSTRCQRVPVSVSMDSNRNGNATGTMDVRDLPALP